MKNILFLTALFAGLFGGAVAAQNAPQTLPLEDPQVISLGSDEPRYPLLPYNTAEAAMSGDVAASTYVQRLDGTWKVKTFASAEDVDTLLTAVGTDLSSWGAAPVPAREKVNAPAAIYRTEFKMPFAWVGREVFVHVGPVSRAYYVYVNGEQAGYFEDSKAAAEFNVTRFATEGKNHLSIIAYADPASTRLEDQIPGRGTAVEGDVYVFSQPRVRMRDYVADTRFAPDGTSGLFNLGVVVKTHLLNPREVMVYYDLFAPDSTKIASGRRDARFDMRREDTVRFFANIPRIDSWSHENPKLYTVLLRLQHEGRFTEYTTIKVGFRDVTYDENGLIINGSPIELRGIDYLCPPDEASLRRDLASFRQQGINLLRVSNFPQRQTFYELCDRYGIYVCDQANLDTRASGPERKIDTNPANDTLWARAYADRVMDMYYASQNHPSVVMFSLGGQAGQGYNLYEAYLRLKEVEKQRPVIYEGAGAEWNTDMVVGSATAKNPSDKRYVLSLATPSQWQASPVKAGGVSLHESDQADEAILKNGFRIVNLSSFRVGYSILSGKRVLKEEIVPVSVVPQSRGQVKASLEGLKPGKYTLRFFVTPKENTPWCSQSDCLSEVSWEVAIAKEKK